MAGERLYFFICAQGRKGTQARGSGSIHLAEPPPFSCQHKQLNTERMPPAVRVSVSVCLLFDKCVWALSNRCHSPFSTTHRPVRPACLRVVCSGPGGGGSEVFD